jgi:hypothetical protein
MLPFFQLKYVFRKNNLANEALAQGWKPAALKT